MKRPAMCFRFAPILLSTLLALPPGSAAAQTTDVAERLPDAFVHVDEIIPELKVNLRYAGSDNFTGRPVPGYEAERLILTRDAAIALSRVQDSLLPFGLGLLVYDGYRPQRAVDAFVQWAADLEDQVNKAAYYPDVDKRNLFAEGYIAERSGHTRGSTLDLTLVDLATGTPLDMGTPWDHFGPESWPDFVGITAQQRASRLLLRSLMLENGFRPYPQEWWHFTLAEEPFPDTYFDFPVR